MIYKTGLLLLLICTAASHKERQDSFLTYISSALEKRTIPSIAIFLSNLADGGQWHGHWTVEIAAIVEGLGRTSSCVEKSNVHCLFKMSKNLAAYGIRW